MKKISASAAMIIVWLIFSPNIIIASGGCDEALSKGKAETLNPDSDAVKKAIDDYAWVSGLEAGWRAVGHAEDKKSWVEDMGEVADTVRNPLEKAAEKGMTAVVSFHTNSKLKMLYDAYKQKMAYQKAPAGNKPKITRDYDKNANLEIEAIKDFARSAGCPPDPNFQSSGSNENRFFRAWIEERYRKEKEAAEILNKAKELDIPINVLSPKRGKAEVQGTVWGSTLIDRKISTNPYTSFNRTGQMDWNYDILRYSVAKYKKFEQTLEGRLDEIFEQNGLSKNLLKLCYDQARDTVKKDYLQKAYELMCQGKDTESSEYLNKDISENICKFLPNCLPLDYKNKKLDCQKKETPETKTETKTDSKPKDPSKKDQSAAPKTKEELNGCLCRCTITPTVGVGATYDPNAWKNASPSCDDARYGTCVGFGLGCWREHMRSDGKCFEQCVTAANAKPQEVKAEIYQTRFKAYNDFLGEARSIIEKYLANNAKFSQKKSIPGINRDFIQLAGNFPDNAMLGQILFAAASPGTGPTAYAEMVREKNRRGDPDKALGLVRSAEAVMPERKASGETTNILAEFAITMSKASLNIVTELEFDEGIYLLRKAAEFYTAGKSSPLGENIKRLTGNFEKWKENWQILKSEIPGCLVLIKDKRVCECDRLNSEKITPAANSLTIYEFASSEKWSISTASGIPRAIPEKDKIYNELKDKLSKAKNECANNPAMNTKEMKNLTDYDTRKSLEKSPYINQQDLKINSASVICDTRAVKNAEKLLSAPGLCDCQQEKIKGILDTAKKDERPLVIEFGADKKELAVGERVMLSLSIKGGQPPFSADMIGDYPYTMRSEARGFNINYQAGKVGTNNFYVTVVDSCGDSGSKKISINVKQAKSSKILPPTAQETAKTSSPTQTPTSIKKQPPVYDPTKDRNIKDKGKAIDVDSVDSLSNEFNDASMKSKKPGSDKASQQTPIAQTDTYKGSVKKADETNEIKDPNQNYPPYSYPPQNDFKSGQGKDWTKWATKSKTQDSSSRKSSNWASDNTKDKGSSGVTTSDSSGTSSDKSSGLSITAVYENKSDQNVHIFTEGETFSPANRLAPGESRKVNVKMPANGIIKFYAGRNGQVLSSKTWGGDPDHLDRYPMVRFTKGMDGKEILVITTNLK